jgi:NADH-quinone oxidoreductase subunit M
MAFFLMLFTMAAVGLPGLNGFVSEFLTILGAFTSPHLGVAYGSIAAIGIVLGAVYMLHFATKLLFGPLHYPLIGEEHETHQTVHPRYVPGADITGREVLVLTPLAVAVVVLGLFPRPLLKAVERPLEAIRNVRPTADLAKAKPAPAPGNAPLAVVAERGSAAAR